MTFDEEFDAPSIDAKKWNIYGPNYWDKASHWSKDNLILGGGVARLRFEKKRGPHNDDPRTRPQNLTGQIESDYACGYLDTYDKWVQRYGYFEARVKLPRVPGLWSSARFIGRRATGCGVWDTIPIVKSRHPIPVARRDWDDPCSPPAIACRRD